MAGQLLMTCLALCLLSVAQSSDLDKKLPTQTIVTVHKEGRRQIPVQVNVNRQEETITAIPRSLHPHDNLETFFDFKLGIAIYRAQNETECYLELLEDFSFEEAAESVKQSQGVFIRRIPDTLFVADISPSLVESEWVGADRLKEFCNGRQIYQLVSKPEIDGREAEIKIRKKTFAVFSLG